MNLTVSIPKPCPVSQQALSPTAAGWHCGHCQTEIIDFTRLSEAEVLAYLAERRGQRVCAAMQAPLVPQHSKRPQGLRRWVLAAATLLGWQSAEALPPRLPPGPVSFFGLATGRERIVVRGVVLDDLFKVPVEGAYIFIKGTKYGAVTNQKGEFSFSFSSDWQLAKSGSLLLEISANPFSFQRQLVTVYFKRNVGPAPLTIRLLSQPERGFVMGKPILALPPTAPPDAHKSRP